MSYSVGARLVFGAAWGAGLYPEEGGKLGLCRAP